jgi:hypothetical protein
VSKRSTPAVHLCRFRAQLLPGNASGPCSLKNAYERCSPEGSGRFGVLYAWGTAVLCQKHMLEETEPPSPEPTKGPSTDTKVKP